MYMIGHHHMDNLHQYFLYLRQWFLNFLVSLLKKILNTKI
jgi:hypothetical protein